MESVTITFYANVYQVTNRSQLQKALQDQINSIDE